MTRSSDTSRPEITRWFEDFHEGEIVDLGTRTPSRDEIVDFAAKWDPQPMHLDEAAGAASILGGLAASGWHTAAIVMRLFCDRVLLASSSLGSPGIDRLKWKKPVHPGETLAAHMTVLSTRTSASRPRLGFVKLRFDATDGEGDTVLVMETTVMFERRGA